MTKAHAILAVIFDLFLLGFSVYHEEWFLTQIILVTQVIMLITAMAYQRQQGVGDSDAIVIRRKARLVLPFLLLAGVAFFLESEWKAPSNWLIAGQLITDKKSDLSALLGICIAAITTAGSVLLQRRSR